MRDDPPGGGGLSWPPPATGGQPAPSETPLAPPPAPGVVPAAPPAGPRHRHRLLLTGVGIAVLAAAAAGVALAVGGSSTATGGAAAARGLLARALSDAGASGSFHYVSVSSSSARTGKVTQETIGDAGATQGRQDITVNGDRFTVLVVGPTSFFQGDAAAMATSLGVSPSVAQAHAGQWVSLVSGDTAYQSVTAAVTTSSALEDNLTFRATQVLPDSTLAGRSVRGIRGPMQPVQGQPARGTATLYVTAGAHPLPVRYVEKGTVGTGSSAGSLDFSIAFSRWGDPVSVAAPGGAIAFSSLGSSGATPAPGPTVFA